MDKKRTGELIRDARTKKGYTQSELGDRIGVSNKAVSRWENGDSFPDIGVLESLAGELGISIEAIIVGERKEHGERTEQVLTEVLHMAKLQAAGRRRMWISGLTGGILLAYILICGGLTLFAGWIHIPRYLYGIGLLLGAAIVVIKSQNGIESISTNHDRTKGKRIFWGMAGIAAFLIALLGIVCLQAGHIPTVEITHPDMWGKGLNCILAVGYGIGVVVLTGSYLLSLKKWQPGEIQLLALGLIHLSLVYSNLLHQMTDVGQFASAYGVWTGIVVAVIILAIFIEKGCRSGHPSADSPVQSHL